jgi:endoglucanase
MGRGACALAVAVVGVCLSGTPTSVAGTTNPLAGVHFWVDPNGAAAQAAAKLRSQGDTTDAASLDVLAAQPNAVWLTSTSAPTQISSTLSQATRAGQVPVFVTYYLPGRDCGGYSSGGAANAGAYASWVNSIATTIGTSAAVVVVEPDAIPEIATGCFAQSAGAYESMLSAEIGKLKQLPKTSVYLDAGNPSWVTDPSKLVTPLQRSSLGTADGFALNVSNFQTLTDDTGYGDRLSTLTGGKHYVVDTGRNGLGPLPPGSGYTGPSWCNPPGRAIGVKPTPATGHGTADAYLWIKTPGASDGSCGLGDPPAGTFWVSYALGLVNRAS